MLVVGDKEATTGQASVRIRNGQDLGSKPLTEFAALATRLIAEKSLELS
jgi:threonyl-tRNA synthetase